MVWIFFTYFYFLNEIWAHSLSSIFLIFAIKNAWKTTETELIYLTIFCWNAVSVIFSSQTDNCLFKFLCYHRPNFPFIMSLQLHFKELYLSFSIHHSFIVLEKKLYTEPKFSLQLEKNRINLIKKHDPLRQLLQSAEEKETKQKIYIYNYLFVANVRKAQYICT